jgi:hypothetical protein
VEDEEFDRLWHAGTALGKAIREAMDQEGICDEDACGNRARARVTGRGRFGQVWVKHLCASCQVGLADRYPDGQILSITPWSLNA